MTADADRGAIGFAENLLSVLDEGVFTATYKYAVILGLMDLCLENSTRTGSAPPSVTTRQLAEKILELYWDHTTPYRGEDVLRQNAGGQAAILSAITRFRAKHPHEASGSLHATRISIPNRIIPLVNQIEWTLVKMPLPKLQRIGGNLYEFFYTISWDDDITKGAFRSADFDNLIRFVGQSGDHLVRLATLLRPLVQREWADRVIRLNQEIVGEPELDAFLFGAERTALGVVRDDLRDLQDGRCFYCCDSIGGGLQVDHFIPWARYPDNGIENLVAAHDRCNNRKRDHLACAEHVSTWLERATSCSSDLAEIAMQRSWVRHPTKTLSVARSIYLRQPEGARLWELKSNFVPLDRSRLLEVFRDDLAVPGD